MGILSKINALRGFNINNEISKIVNLEIVKEAIIRLNQDQLREGEDFEGDKLETYASISPDVYSRVTIAERSSRGLPTDRVDLFVTGKFYASFSIANTSDGFIIIANFDKGDGNISDNLDTSKVLGLNENNVDKVVHSIIKPLLVGKLRYVLSA